MEHAVWEWQDSLKTGDGEWEPCAFANELEQSHASAPVFEFFGELYM
jgi:hypothetical protein